MSKLGALIVFITCFASSNAAYAGFHTGKVSSLWVTGGGDFTLTLDSGYGDACWLGAHVQTALLQTDSTPEGVERGKEQRDKLYSMLVTAKMSGLDVTVVSGGSDDCAVLGVSF